MLSTEFIITSLIVVLIPGTGVIYTVSMGLFHGFRASAIAALGCTAGIIPHLAASILGLATLLHMSAVAFQTIKFAGVAYLLYLAWGLWKDTGSLALDENKLQGSAKSAISIASKGFLINILNPKLSLFFLAFLPQFIPQQTAQPMISMLLLGGTFMIMTLGVFILYGFFATSIRDHVIHSPKIIRNTQKSFAAMFALLGVKLALAER